MTTMKAYFRSLAAAFRAAAPAQALAGLSVLICVLYTGYTLPMPSMIGALKWITYINVRLLICMSGFQTFELPDLFSR